MNNLTVIEVGAKTMENTREIPGKLLISGKPPNSGISHFFGTTWNYGTKINFGTIRFMG